MHVLNQVAEQHIDGDVAVTMLAQSPQCIKLIDESGRLRFMSDNGQRLMEIDDFDAVRDKTWWTLWPESSRQTLQNAVAAARRGVSVSFEAACPTAKGVEKHWSVRVSQIKGGELNGMIVAASEDISDQVALQDAQKKLQLDNLALRRFARFVAHDLRGPIRHHKLLSEMITLSPDAENTDAVEYASEIGASADALLNMLTGLEQLHVADNTAGAAKQTIAISEIVTRAADMVGSSRFNLSLECEDIEIHVHADQMTAVFSNLLENAIKYGSRDGMCEITVTASVGTGGEIDIVLSDTGPGFGEDRIDEVFQPLVRQANSADIPGSGIGLARVERIMNHEGGTVRVLSKQETTRTGAAIHLQLPAPACLAKGAA